MSNASIELGGGNWAAKDGKLLGYAVGDTSGKYIPREFDFTRNSDIAATRVNEDGLIEKHRENLLLHSNQFDTTWTTTNASVTSGESGYDGSSDAWLLGSTGGLGRLVQSISQGGVQTLSFYAKAGTYNFARPLGLDSSTNPDAFFDLSTGTIASIDAACIDAQIEKAGGGWYRCSITYDTTISEARIYPAFADGDASTYGGNIYIQDAQLEQGLVATDYLESGASTGKAGILENLPRIDYTDGSASLLLEPQRVNLVDYSEYFGAWNTKGTASVTDNQAVSPEGVSNAALLDFGSTTSGANRIDLQPAVSSGTDYLFSVFVKNIDANRIGIRNYNTTNDAIANFDFSSGSFSDTNINVIDTIVESYGNGWYRIGIVSNSGAATFADVRISPDTTSGSDGEQIYIYGAQLEVGSYPTSYIPTYGVSVTREEDNMDTTFSSPLSTDGGVSVLYYIKGTDKKSGISANARYLNFATDSGLTTPYIAYNRTDEEHRVRVYDGTVSTYSKAEVDIENDVKIVVVAEGDTHKVFSNGVLRYTRTTNSIDWSSITDFVHTSDDDIGVIDVKQALLFPTALTDSECIALTTL